MRRVAIAHLMTFLMLSVTLAGCLGGDDNEDVFTCENGDEIPSSSVNDGKEDCADGSDEGDIDDSGNGGQDGSIGYTAITSGVGMVDICSGKDGSWPGQYTGLTVMGTRLYFEASECGNRKQLWAYEATNSSAWKVTGIGISSNGTTTNALLGSSGLTAMGTRLFFDATDQGTGSELWTHETTNSSTWLVADINKGNNKGSYPGGTGSTVMGTRLYFDANDGSSGRELWAHETTNSSTWQVADIKNGSDSSYPGENTGLTVMGTRLYFDADDGDSGVELWAHETTNSSTWQVVDIFSGSGHGNPGWYSGITVMGTRLYFAATNGDVADGSSGFELWAHETINGSTWLVENINKDRYGRNDGYPGSYAGLTVIGTRLYFDAYDGDVTDGSSGFELWAHESTNSSTWLVSGIDMGSDSYRGVYAGLTVMGTRLYFDADDGDSGVELWAHETTNSSTWQVADINSGIGSGFYGVITMIGTRLYFSANDGSSGYELWAHETTNSSTWQVVDINNGSGHGNPGTYAGLTVMGNQLYFDADDSSGNRSGFELWIVDI